jgi:RND family efflux transporter MFP subunit
MRRLFALVVFLVPSSLLTGCERSNEFVPPPPPTVTVAAPEARTVTTYKEFTGRLVPTDSVEIRARVRGYLNSMDFEPGHVVEKSALLFTIQPEQYEADLATAEADLAQKQADLALQEATLQRVQAAFDRDAATELEVLQQRAQRDGAAARVQSAEAAVAQATLNLSYTKITSPITGRVSRERVDVGNLVGASDATLLTTVVNDNPMYIYFNVSERDVIQLISNQGGRQATRRSPLPVLLTLADGTQYDTPGEIVSADNTVNPETGTLEVRASVENAQGILAPGMFVRVRVPNEPVDALLVSEIAFQRDLEGDYALVVDDSGKVARKNVTLGEVVGAERMVLSGLTTEDRVIVRGLQRSIPGRQVTAETTAPADTTTGDGT